MSTTPVIRTDGLVKTFGSTRALDGLDLSVTEGEVHGFLGPNGAGKSTTIRVLLGLLRADGGEVTLFGADPWDDAVALHHRLAYVPGDVELWPNLTGGEAIDLFARLRGTLDKARRNKLCERFDLDPTKKARTYSKGNRQKVALISALASPVDLLLLDEPTAGLDPLMELVFQDCIREARAAGTTVLLSSHILAQVEVLADRISIVRAGQVVETGSLDDLRHMTRTSIVARTDHPADGMQSLTGVHDVTVTDDEVRLEVDGEHVGPVIRQLSELGLRSITAHPPTLEQLLVSHYGEQPQATSGGAESNHSRRSVEEGAAQEGSVEEGAAR